MAKVKTVKYWTARPAGEWITLTGKDENGADVTIPDVETITTHDGLIVAVLASGADSYILRTL